MSRRRRRRAPIVRAARALRGTNATAARVRSHALPGATHALVRDRARRVRLAVRRLQAAVHASSAAQGSTLRLAAPRALRAPPGASRSPRALRAMRGARALRALVLRWRARRLETAPAPLASQARPIRRRWTGLLAHPSRIVLCMSASRGHRRRLPTARAWHVLLATHATAAASLRGVAMDTPLLQVLGAVLRVHRGVTRLCQAR